MIAFAAALALFCAAVGAGVRVAIGPTLHDRAAAAWTCLNIIVCWIAALAVLDGRAAWIDVCVALTLGEFVTAIAVFKAFRVRSLQTALSRRGREPAP